MVTLPHPPTTLASWVTLEAFTWLQALLIFLALATPVVLLGVRSLVGLGPVRRWVAIGARLLVLACLVLILGKLRWQREHTDVEVIVLRDVSDSTQQVRTYPGADLQSSVNDYLRDAVDDPRKQRADRIGVIRFQSSALIEAMPSTGLLLGASAIPLRESGTDPAAAIQLALATLSRDAMHRILLIWDGNATEGDLESAIAAASAARVPIDVMPLRYDVQQEVLMERLVAPTWKRENEPFTIEVMLRSTNALPVTGRLTVLHQDQPMDLDPSQPGLQSARALTLQPGLSVERVTVPPLPGAGVHQFRAVFEADNLAQQGSVAVGGAGGSGARSGVGAGARAGDTLVSNNSADGFTFVRGRGQILYVDNVPQGQGRVLRDALAREGIAISDENHITPEQFPNSLVAMQNFDAVILANVPRGVGGISEEQQRMLATYVHDMGGGLLVVGGEEAFGAGGWQGSKLEEILPVSMDVPAERQIAKGALALIMHSCEMPQGNYWGEQCAIKAIETLSSKDEVGIISYGWGNNAAGGVGGAQWDLPLQEKGDGSKALSAVKLMQLGDMPSFDDALELALNGAPGGPSLLRSTARQKHVIIISDGDPQAPSQRLIAQYQAAKVTVSTVTVFTHIPGTPSPQMISIARQTGGKSYGPIEANPNQLPQIFIKEAAIVRRSLIQEDDQGIPLRQTPSASDMVKGLDSFPAVFGMVLTSRKQNPQIEMPLVAGERNDPMLAHWQSGLGRSAVFTSDATQKWAANWVASPAFGKFWAQVVRGVARAPMSSDFDVTTSISGSSGRVQVEALSRDNAFLNFLNIRGTVVGPDMQPRDVRLVQTGPGVYAAEFESPEPGNYVVVLNYRDERGQSGVLLSGAAASRSPEQRDLQSNPAAIARVAERTGGRVLPPFDPQAADLFSRQGLPRSASPLPVWDRLLPLLMGLILLDVAIRRIAWDWASTRKAAGAVAARVRGFTLAGRRREAPAQTLDALRRVRDEVAEQKFRTGESSSGSSSTSSTASASQRPAPTPDRSRKFDAGATAVEGDITQVVGGATDKPVPKPRAAPPATTDNPAQAGGAMGSLLEAKRRAQQKVREKSEGQQ